MPRPRAHAPNTQGGKPAGQDTSSYNLHSEDLSHPVQNIATSILPLKWLWNNNGVKNLPVEQLALRGETPKPAVPPIRALNKGSRPGIFPGI